MSELEEMLTTVWSDSRLAGEEASPAPPGRLSLGRTPQATRRVRDRPAPRAAAAGPDSTEAREGRKHGLEPGVTRASSRGPRKSFQASFQLTDGWGSSGRVGGRVRDGAQGQEERRVSAERASERTPSSEGRVRRQLTRSF